MNKYVDIYCQKCHKLIDTIPYPHPRYSPLSKPYVEVNFHDDQTEWCLPVLDDDETWQWSHFYHPACYSGEKFDFPVKVKVISRPEPKLTIDIERLNKNEHE
jgi:hypothetical protein